MHPLHIAIIIDGNRRWATERGLPVAAGYRRGIAALRRTVRAALRAQIRVVTAYALSEEHWSLPAHEVEQLMQLCTRAARGELRALGLEGVRVRLCGRTDRLPHATRGALDDLVAETADNEALTLNVAIDYRECALASKLYTAGLPDPDLVIRTGGELRLSNFLLYQAASAEFWATGTYWPDFDELQFGAALGYLDLVAGHAYRDGLPVHVVGF
jgi:undecaprenyl diphosphate synthase